MINKLKKHIEDSNFTDEEKIVFFEEIKELIDILTFCILALIII